MKSAVESVPRPPPAIRASLAEDAYVRIKHDLGDFALVPGDRFTENDMCQRLAMSRTPVRQALLRLQQEGLVEVLFRNGWRVLPFDFDRFDQLYDLRVVLETEAVRRLCEGQIRGDESRSEAIVAALSSRWRVPRARRITDPHEVCLMDEQFHLSLMEATGNSEMLRVHQDITNRIRIIRRLDFTQRPRIHATYEEHASIIEAIAASRTDMSVQRLRLHIEGSQMEVRQITLHQLQSARRQSEPLP